MDTASRQVVVIGGGIVGSSTAYFLKKRGINVTILEGSSIAAGASGKAGGLLAYDWTEGQPSESLTKVSYKLHQELAKTFGAESIGYRPVTTVSLAIDTVSNRGKKVPGAEWINNKSVSQSSKLGDERTTAQVHPRLLTQKLAESADKIIYAQAERIETSGSDGKPSAVLAKGKDGNEVKVDCTDVVVAAGPWSGQLVKKLFKNDSSVDSSDYSIVGSRAHSIVLKSSQPLSAMACFTSIRTGKNTTEPELYCRPDGTGYLCGPTDDAPLPERADQVDINTKAIAKLKAEAILISPEALGEKAEVVAEQACFLPISRSTGSPILSELKENVFFAAGHSCWGILQGPATGLAMSELILDGKVSCCDVSELTP
ncbi:FAD dependent oxidoreductase [Cystobasidium minutum MCA 4210]|uniref:FAD dependent oxidoreductase n=1 Tax=Cystobasidium minutum MCA 4210 TaxID=1397322 RepID=UPI0034CF6BD2|eukprot:jgi/Rhomi1/192940/gm1.1154_g